MTSMARRLETEWLDVLPPGDARARRSRRDLERVNALMANSSIVARALRGALPPGGPLHLVELGTGDGRFTARVLRKLPGRSGEAVLVDRLPCLDSSLASPLRAEGWTLRPVEADALEFLERAGEPCDAIFTNLFLHHLDGERLGRLFSLAASRTRLFVACEPRRSALALAGARLLGLIGCNDVTRHDAAASVRAGFLDGELTALWPLHGGWALDERRRGLFSHAFIARRD